MGIEAGIVAFLTPIIGGAAATVAAQVIVSVAISAAVSVAAASLTGKPKMPKGGFDKASRTGNLREALSPHEVCYGEFRKGGITFYLNGTGPDNNILHVCVALASHRIESIDAILLNAAEVELELPTLPANVLPYNNPALGPEYAMWIPKTGSQFRNHASFQWRLGNAGQSAIAGAVMECYNWTADHRARGRAYVYARLKQDDTGETWPSFVPAITAEGKGKSDILDPRTETVGYSDNPALIAADILMTFMGVPRARIHEPSWIEAANICDELVPTKEDGDEKRYRCGGFFLLDGEPEGWLEPVAAAMGGAVIEHNGIYYIRAGSWRETALTITDRDIMSSVRLSTADSDRERSNVAKGVFAGADSFGQPAELPAISLPAAIIEDGAENVLDLDLEFVPGHKQGQRLLKAALVSSRLDRTVEMGLSLAAGLDIMPWDNVELDVAALGIRGTFRVIEHRVRVDGDPPTMSVSILLRETAEEVWEWNAATEEQPFSSADYLLYQPEYTPSDLAFSLTAFTPPYEDFRPAKVDVSWTDPTAEVPDGIDIEARLTYEYRVDSESPWIPGNILVASTVDAGEEGAEIIFELDDAVPEDLEFREVAVDYVKIRAWFGGQTYGRWVVA